MVDAAPVRLSIQNNGLALSALEWKGVDPAIVIMPGITSPAATWSFVAEALQLPNRIVILDVRGRGESAAPAEGYELDDYASDLAHWIEELKLVKPVLFGHSMGARIVAHFDAINPGVAGRLIVVDPPLSGPGRPEYPMPLSFYLDGIASTKEGTDLASMREQSPGWSDERLLDRMRWLPTCALQAIEASYHDFHKTDFFQSWSRTTTKGLFIRGERSPVVTAAGMEEAQNIRADIRYESIPNTGHMIPWDDLNAFVRVVGQYINSINQEHHDKY